MNSQPMADLHTQYQIFNKRNTSCYITHQVKIY